MKMRILLVSAALVASLYAQTPLAPPSQAKERTDDTVVATVEGKPVTLGEVRKMVQADPRLMQFMQQNAQSAIAQVFMLKYLAAEGDKLKLAEQSPLKEQLEQARAAAVASAMVNRERDGYAVTSEQIEAYFQRNRANYEEAHIKAVFIAYKPSTAVKGTTPEDVAEAARRSLQAAHSPKDRTEAEAKALAESVVKQIREGADFAKMVQQYSDDEASKSQGGEFDWVKPNSAFPEEIRKAVFSLKVGEVSDPVKQPTGFYILRLEEKRVPPISQVTSQIVQQLRQDHLNEFMTNLTNRFRPAIQDPEFFARPAAILGEAK
jgi:peptidyl-prolyl cis-trans isomerase C